MPRPSLTHEEFIKLFYIMDENIIVIGKYEKVRDKIQVKCKICGYEWFSLPHSLLKGNGCPKCTNRKNFNKKFHELAGDEYDVLENYVDSKTKIRFKHNKCNTTFNMSPNNFFNSDKCPFCKNILFRKQGLENFKIKVYELVGNEYTVLGSYITSETKILMRHNSDKCNFNEYEVRPHGFLDNNRCPKCSHRSYKKTTEEFKESVFDLVGDEYEVLGDYVTSQDKIKIKHNECNFVYNVTPTNFLNGSKCPNCARINRRINNRE